MSLSPYKDTFGKDALPTVLGGLATLNLPPDKNKQATESVIKMHEKYRQSPDHESGDASEEPGSNESSEQSNGPD